MTEIDFRKKQKGGGTNEDAEYAGAVAKYFENPTVENENAMNRAEQNALSSSADSSTLPTVGIINNSVQCYMNSVLQMLFSTTGFRDKVLQSKGGYPFLDALRSMFSTMVSKSVDPIDPSTMMIDSSNSILDIFLNHPTFRENQQQDPDEFIRTVLFQSLSGDILDDFTFVEKTFPTAESLRQSPSAPSDEHNSQVLTLPITYRDSDKNEILLHSVEEALNNLTHTSDGRSEITPLPSTKYVLFALGRYTYFQDSSGATVVSTIKHDVDPSPYVILSGTRFQLKGVIAHTGESANAGHYRYIHYDSSGDFDYVANDADVVPIGRRQRNMYSTMIQKGGYIYVYERIPSTESPEVSEELEKIAAAAVAVMEHMQPDEGEKIAAVASAVLESIKGPLIVYANMCLLSGRIRILILTDLKRKRLRILRNAGPTKFQPVIVMMYTCMMNYSMHQRWLKNIRIFLNLSLDMKRILLIWVSIILLLATKTR